ncbi:macrophage migration inhibitory factor-like [Lytechinus pictus]|uniref:macrophage migration inhibitory factor-like n=1 Tax=Lytechinus pictus TaxID=7653 RepID=UPI00240DE52D|nr:macrophage migration inhibitory factor-like [Lytechinus pictus]
MPILEIFTNVKAEAIPDGFLKNLNSVWQKAIGKPMQYMCVRLAPGETMNFGGTAEPCALLNVRSIGKLGKEENNAISKALTAEMGKLGVAPDRMYAVFTDISPQDVGFKNTTFAFLA